jgi:large subunit ribosomal protein L13
MAVIDATGHVVGRLASVVAKRLLNGEDIVIVRAEQAILTGRRKTVLATYAKKRGHGSTTSRMRGIGPFYPRRADMILRRSISRMLPYQQARGRDALRRLRVYLDLPDAYKDAPLEIVEVAKRPPQGPVLRLGEVSRTLGSKG